MPRYGLATILGDHPVGYEFTDSNIPLHLTHVDSFEIDLSPEELKEKLQTALKNQKALRVKAMADVLLGLNREIPATKIELTPELAVLHENIMDLLEREGATLKNPHYHRDLYSPHISAYGSRKVDAGEELLIKDISVGTKSDESDNVTYHILATISFK